MREDLTAAEKVLFDAPAVKSTPQIYREGCYICRDPDFAAMGLPLCYRCRNCEGHVPADDEVCDDCGKFQVLFEEVPNA